MGCVSVTCGLVEVAWPESLFLSEIQAKRSVHDMQGPNMRFAPNPEHDSRVFFPRWQGVLRPSKRNKISMRLGDFKAILRITMQCCKQPRSTAQPLKSNLLHDRDSRGRGSGRCKKAGLSTDFRNHAETLCPRVC